MQCYTIDVATPGIIMGIGVIRAKQDTWLKRQVLQADQITDPNNKIECKAGESFGIRWIYDETISGHRKITLDQMQKNFYDWFTYIEHWDVVESHHPKMQDFPARKPNKGQEFVMPGLGKRFSHSPVDGCDHIHWYEITHNLARVPNVRDIYPGLSPSQISLNMIKIAKEADKIRKHYGKPVMISSGYRPPTVNSAVGGASMSRHMWGDALDIVVKGVDPFDVFAHLETYWYGGLASSSLFTHIDLRGYQANWSYGY